MVGLAARDSHDEGSRDGRRIVLLVGCVVVLAAQHGLWSHVSDDAYISFRYVARLVAGEGLTFNPGERVEGFSNPSLVLLLAAIGRVTAVDIVDAARVLGIAAALGTLAIMRRLFDVVEPALRAPGYLLASVLLLAAPGFHVYASSGLEAPLLGLLLIAGVHCTVRAGERPPTAAALLLGLAAVTRPEAPLYCALWWLFTGGPARLRRRPAGELLLLGLLAGPAIAYQSFRLAYYGELLPNTFLAKPSGTFGELFGLVYLLPWFAALGSLVAVPLALVMRWPTPPSLAVLRRAAAGPLLGGLVFVAYAQGDWMPFGRFVVPVWPLWAALGGLWWASAVSWWARAGADAADVARRRRRGLAGAALMLVVAAVLSWFIPLRMYVRDERLATVMRGYDQLAVGQWLHEHAVAGTTVAVGRLGGISYGAPGLVFWDENGLTDREQARFIRGGGLRTTPIHLRPVSRRGPDIVAAVDVPESWGYRNDAGYMAWLRAGYVEVASFRQGNFGSMDLWVARDRTDRLRGVTPAQ